MPDRAGSGCGCHGAYAMTNCISVNIITVVINRGGTMILKRGRGGGAMGRDIGDPTIGIPIINLTFVVACCNVCGIIFKSSLSYNRNNRTVKQKKEVHHSITLHYNILSYRQTGLSEKSKFIGCSPHIQQPAAANLYKKSYTYF